MNARIWLFSLAILIFLIPGTFIGMYIWQAGLDLGSPSSPKAWINVCARGREAFYCKAAANVIRNIKEPVIFTHPNKGDTEIWTDIVRWSGGIPGAAKLERLVSANILLRASLTSGQVVFVDGTTRTVNCTTPDACSIGRLTLYNQNRWNAGEGAVYASVNQMPGEYDFLTPP